jgi:hypothetical protein
MDEIRAKIAELEARLAELVRDHTDVRARLEALRHEAEATSLGTANLPALRQFKGRSVRSRRKRRASSGPSSAVAA